jgi:hypothetical protein
MPDVWLAMMYKTIRHGAHDILPEEEENVGYNA